MYDDKDEIFYQTISKKVLFLKKWIIWAHKIFTYELEINLL